MNVTRFEGFILNFLDSANETMKATISLIGIR